tara:strand:+ start:221 stop:400 length:180 start_codon:yes stop_codon:yes gene_type:complete
MSQRKQTKDQIERALNNLHEAVASLREMDNPSPKAMKCIQMTLGNLGELNAYPEYTIGD